MIFMLNLIFHFQTSAMSSLSIFHKSLKGLESHCISLLSRLLKLHMLNLIKCGRGMLFWMKKGSPMESSFLPASLISIPKIFKYTKIDNLHFLILFSAPNPIIPLQIYRQLKFPNFCRHKYVLLIIPLLNLPSVKFYDIPPG